MSDIELPPWQQEMLSRSVKGLRLAAPRRPSAMLGLVEFMYQTAQQQARPKWNGKPVGNHTADLTDAEIVEVRK